VGAVQPFPGGCTLPAAEATEPRKYNENPVPLTSGVTGRYIRQTCVQYVPVDYTKANPYDGNPFTGMASCTAGVASTTLRITVIVSTPNLSETDPVVLQTWLTPQGP
jgi:hypothetical protein